MRPEVEPAFTADAPTQIGKNIKVPIPWHALPPEQLAEARGFADEFALRPQHHNAAVHERLAAALAIERAVFYAVETA